MRQLPLIQQRGLHLLLNGILFVLCYPLTNFLAQQADVQATALLPFEPLAPFVPWMIVPYASFPLLLAASFVMMRTSSDLQRLSRRMMLCTLLGCLFFAAMPLHFPLTRPEPAQPLLATCYHLLSMMDQPYNQWPSLHVAYCVVLWRTLPRRAWLTLWLGVVAVSTVLTWQHLLLDVAGGGALGLLACWLVPQAQNTRQSLVFFYLAGAALAMLWIGATLSLWLGTQLAMSLALIARAYALHDTNFLAKRAGRHPVWVWALYWPYLIGYRLSWLLVRWHSSLPWQPAGPGLLVGRRLCASEAETLPIDCAIIDLSPELTEPPALCRHYWHFPLLDICAPTPAQLRPILRQLRAERQAGRTVYLHCAMGLSRSRFVAHLHLKKSTR